VIEHNLDVIKTADWLIDMGPEGGSRGGQVIAEGTPEKIAAHPDSHTGEFLRPILEGRNVPVGAAQPELVPANGQKGGPARGRAADGAKPAAKKAAARKSTAKKTARVPARAAS
jgi:excinuclease ABC subunit A